MKLLPSGVHDRAQRCKKSSIGAMLAMVALVISATACAATPRTATNFCRVLADRIDDITTPPVSNAEVQRLIGHYDRLVEVAPIEVEDDLATLRNLFVLASDIDVNDAASVQAVADAAYAAERAAEDTPETIPATTP